MSKKNNTEMKKPKEQIANVPDPAVPNKAHTEMKQQGGNNCRNQAGNRAENKKN